MHYLEGAIFKVSYTEVPDDFLLMLVWIGDLNYILVCLDTGTIFNHNILIGGASDDWSGFAIDEINDSVSDSSSFGITLSFVRYGIYIHDNNKREYQS